MSMPSTRYELLHAFYKFLNTGTCRACGASIEWWLTTNKRKLAFNFMGDYDKAPAVAHYTTCIKGDKSKAGTPASAAPKAPLRPPIERTRSQGVELLRRSLGARAVVAVFDDGASFSWKEGSSGEDLRHELITAANQVRTTIEK